MTDAASHEVPNAQESPVAAAQDASIARDPTRISSDENGESPESIGSKAASEASGQAQASQPPQSEFDFWLGAMPFLLPMITYMVLGSLEPGLSHYSEQPEQLAQAVKFYQGAYCVKLVLTTLVVLWALRTLIKLPTRPHWQSVPLGLLGAAVWIGLCEASRSQAVLSAIQPLLDAGAPMFKAMGLTQGRPAFDPFSGPVGIMPTQQFLFIRFFGLALLVPIVEEAFLRGFAMRYAADPEYSRITFKNMPKVGLIVGTVLPMLMHPASEWVAVIAWFSLVTWWMVKTGSFWDCVIVHAVTNFTLGVYVMFAKAWHLW